MFCFWAFFSSSLNSLAQLWSVTLLLLPPIWRMRLIAKNRIFNVCYHVLVCVIWRNRPVQCRHQRDDGILPGNLLESLLAICSPAFHPGKYFIDFNMAEVSESYLVYPWVTIKIKRQKKHDMEQYVCSSDNSNFKFWNFFKEIFFSIKWITDWYCIYKTCC